MALSITGRHVQASDDERDYIEKKVHRLEKLVDRIDEISVTLSEEKRKRVVEINFRSRSISAFVKCSDEKTLAAIDKAIDKTAAQITKAKAKRIDKKINAGHALRHALPVMRESAAEAD